MKRVVAMLLAVVMVFGLAACGSKKSGDDSVVRRKRVTIQKNRSHLFVHWQQVADQIRSADCLQQLWRKNRCISCC